MNPEEVVVVRSGGKTFIGTIPTYTQGHELLLEDVCEIIAMMSPRAGVLAKQVIITGVDYSSKPLERMVFDVVDSRYLVSSMTVEKERDNLINDYERFCSPEKRIVTPPPSGIVTVQ